MKVIGYQKTVEMEPRPGTRFNTTYYIQSYEQRRTLVEFIRITAQQLIECVDASPDFRDWWLTPIKSFKKTGGGYRSPEEICQDLLEEATGLKRDGSHKDFAQAPIQRWNKLWKDTPYEFEMKQSFQDRITTFDQIMELANV